MQDKFLVGDIEAGGFGAMYARRKLIMQIARAFHRKPIFRFTNYSYEDPFLPLDWTVQTLKSQGVSTASLFTFEHTDNIVEFFDFNSYWNTERLRDLYQTWKPAESSYLMYSGEEYNKLQLNKEYRASVDSKVSALMSSWGISDLKNVVGLHFRRGDKITEGPSVYKYATEETFFEIAKKEYPEVDTFFITSDDANYLEYIEAGYPDFKFIWDREESRYGDSATSNAHLVSTNQSLKAQETFTFVKNVEILKNCKAVIGSYNVQMTKIAGSINSFLQGKEALHLINPVTGQMDYMGSSVFTS